MAEITETEKLAPRMRTVRLGDLKFRVPPTPTLRYTFYIQGLVSKFQDKNIETGDLEQSVEETVRFLRRYNDHVDEAEILESCELAQLIEFFTTVNGGAGDEEDDDAAVPPPRRRSGTAAKTGKSQTTRRSRSST